MAVFTGTTGNDNLVGGAESDTLTGGSGNDTLTGGPGGDIFVYATRGFDTDTITDFTLGQDQIDLSAFGIADFATLSPFITQSGNDTLISFHYGVLSGSNETIRIQNLLPAQFSAANFIFNTSLNPLSKAGSSTNDVLFGGTGNDTLSGMSGNDVLTAGAGNDTLTGGSDNDTLTGGPGNDIFAYTARGFDTDTITDFTLGQDKIDLSVFSIADFATLSPFITQSGNDTLISFYYGVLSGSNETIRIQNLLPAQFSAVNFIFNTSLNPLATTGSSTNDVLFGGAGNDTLSGMSGNDVLTAGLGNDTLTGGSDNDTLTGGSGNDIFAYTARGFDTDTITDFTLGQDQIDLSAFGIADFATLSPFITQSGNDTLISFYYGVLSGSNETIRIQNLLPAQFSAANFIFNTSLNPLSKTGSSTNDVLFGGASNDTLSGMSGNDLLTAGSGNDTLTGGSDNDTLTGGPGNDIFAYTARGFDTDTITDFTLGQDQIDLSAFGIADFATLSPFITQSGNDMLISFYYGVLSGSNETIRIQNLLPAQFSAANFIFNTSLNPLSKTGSSTNDVLFGGAGNDTLSGMSGNDLLTAGSGNDTLTGGSDSDTLTGGSGNDIFKDTKAGLNGDTITDLTVGDKIQLLDAPIAGFTFTLNGATLTYTGGSLTLQNLPTGSRLVASALGSSGVELSLLGQTSTNDFNGDGRSDILWRHNSGVVSSWAGAANGSFTSSAASIIAGVDQTWQIVGGGDFDGDGRGDILWRHNSGIVSSWQGTANGGFTTSAASIISGVDQTWQVVGTGDFNGDGRSDILWRHSSGIVSNWLGTANGSFVSNGASVILGVDQSWTIAGTGDFNGDGRSDILWRHSSGIVSDWLGAANGSFASNPTSTVAGVDQTWHVVGTGDFNGDGRGDILWRNDNGTVSSWQGTANGSFTTTAASIISGVDRSWHVVDTGDFNGDGRSDILWRHDSGIVSDWLGNADGSFTSNPASIIAGIDQTWQVQSPDYVIL